MSQIPRTTPPAPSLPAQGIGAAAGARPPPGWQTLGPVAASWHPLGFAGGRNEPEGPFFYAATGQALG